MPVAGACIYEYTLHLYSYCRKFIRRFIRQRSTYRLDKTGIPVPGLHMGTRIIQPISVRYRLKDTGGRAGTTDEVVVLVCDFWMISNTEQTRTTDEPHNHPSQPTNAHARPRDDRIRGQLSHNPGARTEPRGRLRTQKRRPPDACEPDRPAGPCAARAPWRYRI